MACFKLVDVVPALPKTRSGKILRKTMRGIADGREERRPGLHHRVGEVAGVVDAADEQTAVNGALADCVKHDSDCHVIAIGPFTVGPTN